MKGNGLIILAGAGLLFLALRHSKQTILSTQTTPAGDTKQLPQGVAIGEIHGAAPTMIEYGGGSFDNLSGNPSGMMQEYSPMFYDPFKDWFSGEWWQGGSSYQNQYPMAPGVISIKDLAN